MYTIIYLIENSTISRHEFYWRLVILKVESSPNHWNSVKPLNKKNLLPSKHADIREELTAKERRKLLKKSCYWCWYRSGQGYNIQQLQSTDWCHWCPKSRHPILQQNCLCAAFKQIITRWGEAKLYFHVHTAISKIMLSGPVPESLQRKIYDHMGHTLAAHFWIHQNLSKLWNANREYRQLYWAGSTWDRFIDDTRHAICIIWNGLHQGRVSHEDVKSTAEDDGLIQKK